MGQSNQPPATLNQIYHPIEKAILAGASILFIHSDRERAIQFMLQSIEPILMTDYTGITLFLTTDADTPLVRDFCQSPKVRLHLAVGDNHLLKFTDFHKMRLLLLSSLPETRFGEYITLLHQGQVITAMIADTPIHAITQLRDDVCKRIPKIAPHEAHAQIIHQLPYIVQADGDEPMLIETASLISINKGE